LTYGNPFSQGKVRQQVTRKRTLTYGNSSGYGDSRQLVARKRLLADTHDAGGQGNAGKAPVFERPVPYSRYRHTADSGWDNNIGIPAFMAGNGPLSGKFKIAFVLRKGCRAQNRTDYRYCYDLFHKILSFQFNNLTANTSGVIKCRPSIRPLCLKQLSGYNGRAEFFHENDRNVKFV
jgi:hypothetical protein